MELKAAFASVLRSVRLKKGLTQEDFVLVSSRTNISLLERAGTVPTIEKLEAICSKLEVHPVSFLAACYVQKDGIAPHELMEMIHGELRELLIGETPSL